MVIKTIDAAAVQRCFLAGASALDAKKEMINDLNVFPVPDGDTGTNMTMTIMAAAREAAAMEEPDMKQLCKAISGGSLRGARGNSGVILSQLLRGFTKEIVKVEKADVSVLAAAFDRAVESAYKAVMKPKEGTILTVARAGAEKAMEQAERTDNLLEFMNAVILHMRDVLDQTPEMLPVLKQAGVVDSGGEGLVTIMEGAYDAILGKEVSYEIEPDKTSMKIDNMREEHNERVIRVSDRKEAAQREEEEKAAERRGAVLEPIRYETAVESTSAGTTAMVADPTKNTDSYGGDKTQKKKYAFISVSVGEGLSRIFTDLGVDAVIEGGQTMNPSTQDILHAVESLNAENVFVLPNNSNIILAAEQAGELTKDKNVIVLPTKNIPQGIAALLGYVEEASPEDNTDAMKEAFAAVKSGQVTYAVRDTTLDGKEIKAGDIMGLSDKTIETVGTDITAVTIDLVRKMIDEDSELVTIYYGEEGTEEEAEKIAAALTESDAELEVDIQHGGQPVYYYFVSVE